MITYKVMCNLDMFMPVSTTTSWLLQLEAKHHYAEQELGLSQNTRLSTLATLYIVWLKLCLHSDDYIIRQSGLAVKLVDLPSLMSL